MVDFAPARAARPAGTDEGAWARALVQQCVDDVVLGASRCLPNAYGRFEFSSFRGFGERQLLKARGAYIGPDVVVGVTPLEVCVVELTCFGRYRRHASSWRRSDVEILQVPSRGCTDPDDAWPAALVVDRCERELAELRVAHENFDSWLLLALLFGSRGVPADRDRRERRT
jgi:hypothetical protein